MCIDFVDQCHADDQEDLWVDVVQYSLRHPEFLAKLLDYLGVCGLQPISLIAAIDRRMEIPYLRLRLLRMVNPFNTIPSVFPPTLFLHPTHCLSLPILFSIHPLNLSINPPTLGTPSIQS